MWNRPKQSGESGKKRTERYLDTILGRKDSLMAIKVPSSLDKYVESEELRVHSVLHLLDSSIMDDLSWGSGFHDALFYGYCIKSCPIVFICDFTYCNKYDFFKLIFAPIPL